MDELTGLVAVGTGYVAILMPVLILWVIFYYNHRNEKDKYEAMVAISNNLQDPADVQDLLENFKEKKKANTSKKSDHTSSSVINWLLFSFIKHAY